MRDTELRPRPTYRWVDVWRTEGAAVNVAPSLWDAYREPLLTPEELGDTFPELSERTIRRDLAGGRWPVIDLSDRVAAGGSPTSPTSSKSGPESAR